MPVPDNLVATVIKDRIIKEKKALWMGSEQAVTDKARDLWFCGGRSKMFTWCVAIMKKQLQC